MAIKLAFSTVACPEWTIEQAATKAEEFGYAGIELRTLTQGAGTLACDPALTDTSKVKSILHAHGLEAVCLSTSVCMHYRDDSDGRNAITATRRYLETAAEIGATAVRIFGNEVEPGENRRSVIQRIASRVGSVADRAGELGVQLLFENAGSINRAKDWWWLFNLIDHPMVSLCWNVVNAASAGEGPAVSVPALNSRIALAKVKDTVVGEGVGYVPLGEGNVEVEPFVKRLLGIGYDGYITVEWDRAWLPNLAPADEVLPQARETLQGWLDAAAEAIEKAQGKIDKRKAKEAPKKRAELQSK